MLHNHFVTLIAFSQSHVVIQSQIVASRKAFSGRNWAITPIAFSGELRRSDPVDRPNEKSPAAR
jgi:hypothetical protein